MVTAKAPKDPRSTQRKRARKILTATGRPLVCGIDSNGIIADYACGRSPVLVDAPGGFYPGIGTLQANHKNKNIMDNDPANLEWLCASCHKEIDSTTAKGVSTINDEFGYF
jgi:hypothetical protein